MNMNLIPEASATSDGILTFGNDSFAVILLRPVVPCSPFSASTGFLGPSVFLEGPVSSFSRTFLAIDTVINLVSQQVNTVGEIDPGRRRNGKLRQGGVF